MIGEFYWGLAIITVGFMAFTIVNSLKLGREMRKNQNFLDQQGGILKDQQEQREHSKRRLDESSDRARLMAERQERQLEIAEENLAIQREVRELLDRMVRLLERRA